MAGFRKAKPMQSKISAAIYGAAGSGKTFTSLLIAEGIAEWTGKRVAFVDTENGSDFYAMDIPERSVHPDAFDFDALYTRSITEVTDAVKSLDPEVYSVVVIDSMTHLWEAARNSYRGKTGSGGQIPLHAWGSIKAPYKNLETWLINSPFHFFLLGRQGVDYKEDETGETKAVGTKMKAEGETPHEPNLLLHMEAIKHGTRKEATITAFAEKDRTGILAGKLIEWPKFENIAQPLLHCLGVEQAQIQSSDEAQLQDMETMDTEEKAKMEWSTDTRDDYIARFRLASKQSTDAVEAIVKELTPALKKKMVREHVLEVREVYHAAKAKAEKQLTVDPEPGTEPADPTVDILSDEESEKLHNLLDLKEGKSKKRKKAKETA